MGTSVSPSKIQAAMQSRNPQNQQVQLAIDPTAKTTVAAPNENTVLAVRQAALRGGKNARPVAQQPVTQGPVAARKQAMRGKAGRIRR